MLDTGNQWRLSITKTCRVCKHHIVCIYGPILRFSVRKVSFAFHLNLKLISEHALMKVGSTDSVAHNEVKLNERTSSVWHLKFINFFVGFCTKQTHVYVYENRICWSSCFSLSIYGADIAHQCFDTFYCDLDVVLGHTEIFWLHSLWLIVQPWLYHIRLISFSICFIYFIDIGGCGGVLYTLDRSLGADM